MTISAETRYAMDPDSVKALDTQGLRDRFHVGGLFRAGRDQADLQPLRPADPGLGRSRGALP